MLIQSFQILLKFVQLARFKLELEQAREMVFYTPVVISKGSGPIFGYRVPPRKKILGTDGYPNFHLCLVWTKVTANFSKSGRKILNFCTSDLVECLHRMKP